MSTFEAPKKKVDLTAANKLVEKTISVLGVDPVQCREKVPGQWTLVRGSATIYVDVYDLQGAGYICAASPILKIMTSKKEALYEKLLFLNHQMYAASFSIHKGNDGIDWVWLRIVREIEGLDENEAGAIFNRVGYYADQYDDELKNEFGA